jgi:predicted Fe-Mo cluster-binding NifX family protein
MNRKIVFPTNEQDGLLSRRGAHFGRANFYTVVEIDDNGEVTDVNVVKNAGHSSGGCANAVQNICDLGADVLVVSGIGGSPLKGFMERGLPVYFDNASSSVAESVSAFVQQRLQPMQPELSCSHH